jgi:hypothetical protein
MPRGGHTDSVPQLAPRALAPPTWPSCTALRVAASVSAAAAAAFLRAALRSCEGGQQDVGAALGSTKAGQTPVKAGRPSRSRTLRPP